MQDADPDRARAAVMSPLSDIAAAKPLTDLTSSMQQLFPPSVERLRFYQVDPICSQ